ncbi:hypothetical protein [Nocardia heshunensis]
MLDENTWKVPARWLAKAEPFRDVIPARPVDIAPDAAGRLADVLHRNRNSLAGILANTEREGTAELARAGLEYLHAAEVTPLGAAAVAVIVRDDEQACCGSAVAHGKHLRTGLTHTVIDGWVATQGLSFAVDAVAEMGRLRVWRRFPAEGRPAGWSPWNRYARYSPLNWYDALEYRPGGDEWWHSYDGDLTRLRAHLATADHDTYVAAADRVEALRRHGSIHARLLSSYLLPERQNWLDADLSDPDAATPGCAAPLRMLVASATTADQLDRLVHLVGGAPVQTLYWGKEPIYSMLCQAGPDCLPSLTALLDSGRTGKDIAFVAGLIAQIPTDAAFLALDNRSSDHRVATALAKASARYPQRARRLTPLAVS